MTSTSSLFSSIWASTCQVMAMNHATTSMHFTGPTSSLTYQCNSASCKIFLYMTIWFSILRITMNYNIKANLKFLFYPARRCVTLKFYPGQFGLFSVCCCTKATYQCKSASWLIFLYMTIWYSLPRITMNYNIEANLKFRSYPARRCIALKLYPDQFWLLSVCWCTKAITIMVTIMPW